MELLESNSLLSPHQYGFRSGKSTTLQLLEVLYNITKCLDEGDTVDVIYLDFQKAFDTVPHVRLLRKMASLGLERQIRDWANTSSAKGSNESSSMELPQNTPA